MMPLSSNSLTNISIEIDDLAMLLRAHGVDKVAEILEVAKEELEIILRKEDQAAQGFNTAKIDHN